MFCEKWVDESDSEIDRQVHRIIQIEVCRVDGRYNIAKQLDGQDMYIEKEIGRQKIDRHGVRNSDCSLENKDDHWIRQLDRQKDSQIQIEQVKRLVDTYLDRAKSRQFIHGNVLGTQKVIKIDRHINRKLHNEDRYRKLNSLTSRQNCQ